MTDINTTDIGEMLRQVSLFGHLPEQQLQWLAEQGTEVWLEPGEQIAAQGDPADGFYVILQGETTWTKDIQGETAHAVTLGAGEVFAELILLLDEPYPTTGRAVTKVRLYKLTPDCFWEMLRTCPSIFRKILKISAQRSQIHESVTQQQAKLISLGTLSAG
ncbi:MAG: cyclic nucleotide-binding domain-containing protein [Leptolyngbyaceae cyanobacterium RM2_2_4]|nr:cyclic nucleotide-binding domain-containing protein [Leptolyngbyaceae cyanobacterium RM2_2_4]